MLKKVLPVEQYLKKEINLIYVTPGVTLLYKYGLNDFRINLSFEW